MAMKGYGFGLNVRIVIGKSWEKSHGRSTRDLPTFTPSGCKPAIDSDHFVAATIVSNTPVRILPCDFI
jgi:hypothetical protein